jgi:hypothetical protein
LTDETWVELEVAVVLTGAQTYQSHEHIPGVCDLEGGCTPPPPDYDDTYKESVSGNNTETFQDGAAAILHLKPDGSYKIQLFFQTPEMTGTWSDSWSGKSDALTTGSQPVHIAVESTGGSPDPTALNDSHSGLVPRSIHDSIVVPTTLTMTWDLRQQGAP